MLYMHHPSSGIGRLGAAILVRPFGLSGAAMIFPISLIAFKKIRTKVMFWKKNMVSFYCVIINYRTNIHNDSCRV